MKVKVYKIEIMIIDHDQLGEVMIRDVLENTKYPNWCIRPEVRSVEWREVDWRDNHPLNFKDTDEKAYRELFQPRKAMATPKGTS